LLLTASINSNRVSKKTIDYLSLLSLLKLAYKKGNVVRKKRKIRIEELDERIRRSMAEKIEQERKKRALAKTLL